MGYDGRSLSRLNNWQPSMLTKYLTYYREKIKWTINIWLNYTFDSQIIKCMIF